MKYAGCILPVVALISGASAASAPDRNCRDITIPVDVTSEKNINIPFPAPEDNIGVTDLVLNLYRGQSVTLDPATVSGSYELAATYCEPASGPSDTLQILTHGIGFDRTYWDFPLNNYNFSYVNYALDNGYSTLSWDRLGLGESSHGDDPVNEIQAPLEAAALVAMTKSVRAAAVPGLDATFDKIVHVGHSLGSAITYAMSVLDDTVSDGLILTAFSQWYGLTVLPPIGLHIINAEDVAATSSYPLGYFAQADPSAVQVIFFANGQFAPETLDAAVKAGQPLTMGEFFTMGLGAEGKSTASIPVLIITGEHDFVFCASNCYNTQGAMDMENNTVSNILELSHDYFTNTEPTTFIVPGAGHGLNLDYTWPTTYGKVTDFLAQNGLAA